MKEVNEYIIGMNSGCIMSIWRHEVQIDVDIFSTSNLLRMMLYNKKILIIVKRMTNKSLVRIKRFCFPMKYLNIYV